MSSVEHAPDRAPKQWAYALPAWHVFIEIAERAAA
jgi:hypothetical protein